MNEEVKIKVFGTFTLGENFPSCKVCAAPLKKFTGLLPKGLLNEDSRDVFLENLDFKEFTVDSFCEVCAEQETITFVVVEDTSIPYLKKKD